MEASIWNEPAVEGVRSLRVEAGSWALSPDDQWLAWADARADEAGNTTVWCAEVSTGRVVFEKRGAVVKALGWASSEQLVVVRGEAKVNARAVLFAVPDGGVLGSVALESLPGSRCKVEAASGAPVVLVAPVRWHAAPRTKEPARRLAYVLRTDPLEVIARYDPDESAALPRVPEVRMAVASLAPDGHRLIVWQGAPSVKGLLGVAEGAVLSYAWSKGRDVKLASAGHQVDEVAWLGPDTVALRSAAGDELAHRGDLDVVDLSRGVSLYSSVGEDQPDGWMSGRSTVDVHPDRDRLLVTGREATGATGARAWSGLVRVIDPAAVLATRPRVIAGNVEVAMGAAWLPAMVGGVAVLRARTQREAELVRLSALDAGADGATRVAVALGGKKPSGGRVSRSPGETMLVVRWRVDPENSVKRSSTGSRYIDGPLSATRLAFVDVGRLMA